MLNAWRVCRESAGLVPGAALTNRCSARCFLTFAQQPTVLPVQVFVIAPKTHFLRLPLYLFADLVEFPQRLWLPMFLHDSMFQLTTTSSRWQTAVAT
jgi:hypothetical protein